VNFIEGNLSKIVDTLENTIDIPTTELNESEQQLCEHAIDVVVRFIDLIAQDDKKVQLYSLVMLAREYLNTSGVFSLSDIRVLASIQVLNVMTWASEVDIFVCVAGMDIGFYKLLQQLHGALVCLDVSGTDIVH
jgi:hypothetical protein